MASSTVVADYTETDEFFGQIRLEDPDAATDGEGGGVGGAGNDAERRAPLIVLRNVHKTYMLGVEGVPALRGVSLSIFPGEFVVVYGTSGGGKTTLMNIMGTIDKPTKGNLSLDGVRVTDSTSDATLAQIRLTGIGFVFQTFNLLAPLSAVENVEMPMILADKLTAAERRARATKLLTDVGLGHRLHHKPSQLSGGEQQRVTIARAIANQPRILLMDEPTGDLDSYNTAIVLELVCKLHSEGMTIIMVTHDVHIKGFADRVFWMRDGKLQRIERVSPDSRPTSRRQMQDVIAKHEAKESATDAAADAARLESLVSVEVRQPADYETSVDHVEGVSSTENLRLDVPNAEPFRRRSHQKSSSQQKQASRARRRDRQAAKGEEKRDDEGLEEEEEEEESDGGVDSQQIVDV
jgi:putative ABC transport system ATP-binding protein